MVGAMVKTGLMAVAGALALSGQSAWGLKPLSEGEVANKITLRVALQQGEELKPIGSIRLGLFNKKLPKTTENFEHVCQKHFANTTFHRVIPDFMAQAGDYTKGDGTGGGSKWGREFEDEAFLYQHDVRGALSMANRGKNTNGSQFFITFAATPWLDSRHVVFGCILSEDDSMTLSKIESHGSSSGQTQGVIKITSCHVSAAPAGSKCYASSSKTDL